MKKLLNFDLVIVMLLACILAVAINRAWASGDHTCQGGHNCNGGSSTVDTTVKTVVDTNVNNTLTAGDNTSSNSTHIDGSRALGLSNSLGDVDIAGCMASTQYGTPIWSKQKLVPNWFCVAELYIRTAQYDLAAMAFCNTAIRDEFDSEEACRAAHNFGPQYVEPVVIIDEHDEHQDEIDKLAEQVAMLATQQTVAPATTIIQQPYLSKAKREALAEVIEK